MIGRFLFKQIDNSALIVFRIFFGILICLEACGSIVTVCVSQTMIDPGFTFSFIGFEWLQPLPGDWMYAYYLVMGLFGLFVALGYKYRMSIVAYTIMWAVTYFMQKSSYNNHYYLLILLCLIMSLLPANRFASVDASLNKDRVKHSMPQWCSWILILQMWIVYTYASVAKMYPDWLDTSVIEILMKPKEHYFLVGELLQEKWLHYGVAYGGILFDLLVIPLLLWKPTRMFAFYTSLFFHLFNSAIFQVGIFPYMSIALCLFFFDPETIRRKFLKRKPKFEGLANDHPKNWKPFFVAALVYFMIQVGLPLRHWFIQDKVLWTEEGHRLSWRMMLRSRAGTITYNVLDKETNTMTKVDLNQFLSTKQRHLASSRPDVIWQFAQYLKKINADAGKEVSVFVNCYIRINGRPFEQLIDPEVDLAAVKWNAFKHSEWILPSKLDRNKQPNH